MISSEKITELRRSESAAVLDLLQIQFTKKNLASPSLDLRQQGCNAEWTERCDWVLGVLGREAWCNTSMTLKLVLALQTVGGDTKRAERQSKRRSHCAKATERFKHKI